MGKHILIVDDDEDDQVLFCDIAQQMGNVVCHLAFDTRHATEKLNLAPRQYDLIFLDINLPDGSGIDFLKSLKREEYTREIPVIMISSSNRPEQILECFTLGATDYFQKPPVYSELRSRLQKIIETQLA